MGFHYMLCEFKTCHFENEASIKILLESDKWGLDDYIPRDEVVYLPNTSEFGDYEDDGYIRFVISPKTLEEAFRKGKCDYGIKVNKDCLYLIVGDV